MGDKALQLFLLALLWIKPTGMKYIWIAVLLAVAKTPGCNKQKTAGIPDCIQQKINTVKGQPKANPPIEVQQYAYNGKTVYLVTSGCCDQYNVVFDEKCQYICAPSGGLTGKGDRKCPDFIEKATFVRTIWKDER